MSAANIRDSHERGSERTDERVAQYLRLYSCLFQTTVQSFHQEVAKKVFPFSWLKKSGQQEGHFKLPTHRKIGKQASGQMGKRKRVEEDYLARKYVEKKKCKKKRKSSRE